MTVYLHDWCFRNTLRDDINYNFMTACLYYECFRNIWDWCWWYWWVTETSNLYEKRAVFDISCKDEPWKNNRCKLITKPRRYGGKSHPATPTQEQTRPISTEASNLDKEYAVSDICGVNGHCRNKTLQTDDQTAQIWWKISSRDPNSGADETNDDGN